MSKDAPDDLYMTGAPAPPAPPETDPASPGLFMGLAAASAILITLPPILAWLAVAVLLIDLWPTLSAIMTWSGLAVLLLSLAIILLPLALPWSGSSRLWPGNSRMLALIYHPAVLLGRLLDQPTEKTQASFLELNNRLVEAAAIKYPPDKILVLLPHCLQIKDCPIRLTHNVHACKGCGRCDLAEITNMCAARGVNVAIAPGGTLARKIIKNIRPSMAVAVACERDLISGIQDSLPLPVYGILNSRPCGPCLDTRLYTPRLASALEKFSQPPAEASNT